MLVLSITTAIGVMGALVGLALVRRGKPLDSGMSVDGDLRPDAGDDMKELRKRLIESERAIERLRVLYVNLREESTRQLADARKDSLVRDAELRREIVEPDRRLGLAYSYGKPVRQRTEAPTDRVAG
jgi:hypothetical protein